jgi:hypothetical protein
LSEGRVREKVPFAPLSQLSKSHIFYCIILRFFPFPIEDGKVEVLRGMNGPGLSQV